jgi:hypothetical protein
MTEHPRNVGGDPGLNPSSTENGGVAEWPIAPASKTGGPKGPVSSNLTTSAIVWKYF